MATVRYFAAARAAAGVPEETIAATSIAELTATAADRHGEALRRVLASCSFLVDGLACRDPGMALPEASTVDVLPPFAGG
jgi:sulfur-carrier protein